MWIMIFEWFKKNWVRSFIITYVREIVNIELEYIKVILNLGEKSENFISEYS